MKDYILNLLPRLKEFSKSLDHKETFVDQPWVLIDEEGNKHQYIFKRDGRLLMSLNGKGQEGKWEYLPEANSLWIDRVVDKILLIHAFIDEAVMILSFDTIKKEPWLLANAKKIPDLDISRHLRYLLNLKFQAVEIQTIDGILVQVHGAMQTEITRDLKVFVNDIPAADQAYHLKDSRILYVKSGRIASIRWEKIYDSNFGKLTLIQSSNEAPVKGDLVSESENIPYNEFVSIINEQFSLLIKDGVVQKVKWVSDRLEVIIMTALLLMALAFAVTILFYL